MRKGLQLYFHLAKASWRAAMVYKTSFMLSVLFNSIISIADFMVILAILYRFREIGDWGTAQIGVLYGIATASVGLYRTFGCELHRFQSYIINGEYDGVLLRPWPSMLVLLSRQVELFRLGGVLQGYTALVISLTYLATIKPLSLALYIYLLVLPIISSSIYFAIGIAVSAVAFWTGRIRELQTVAIYGPSYAAAYPISIYPKWLQWFLTVLPVSFVSYIPVRYALGLGGIVWHLCTPVFIGLLALYASLALWRAGERAYHSTGS